MKHINMLMTTAAINKLLEEVFEPQPIVWREAITNDQKWYNQVSVCPRDKVVIVKQVTEQHDEVAFTIDQLKEIVSTAEKVIDQIRQEQGIEDENPGTTYKVVYKAHGIDQNIAGEMSYQEAKKYAASMNNKYDCDFYKVEEDVF